VKRFEIRRVWRERSAPRGAAGDERYELVAETAILSEALNFPAVLSALSSPRPGSRYVACLAATGEALALGHAGEPP
jgi:hypothetical protein